MEIQDLKNEGQVIIIPDRVFDYKDNKTIQECWKNNPDAHFVFDFKNVEIITSATLGMLLLLKDKTKTHEGDRVVFVNCNNKIENIFRVAKFYKFYNQ